MFTVNVYNYIYTSSKICRAGLYWAASIHKCDCMQNWAFSPSDFSGVAKRNTCAILENWEIEGVCIKFV